MSNGGWENGKDIDYGVTTTNTQSRRKKKPSIKDGFALAIGRIAVAQVCESCGFQSFQKSALEAFSDVAVRYICEVGKTANTCANLAGRSECNVFDLIQCLEDLGSSLGFGEASKVNRCLARSSTFHEIAQYVTDTDEIPFPYSIPEFPVFRARKQSLSFLQAGEIPPSEHIPHWLPAFPDLKTYSRLPSRNEKVIGGVDKIENEEKEPIKMEGSFSALHQQIGSDGYGALVVNDMEDAGKVKQAAGINPFLATPFLFGEKEVSLVALPDSFPDETPMENHAALLNNHVSVSEVFAPAIEAVKSRPRDPEDAKEKVSLDSRPTVHFKFKKGKRTLRTSPISWPKDLEKTSSWFEDNYKNDEKMRAEQILKESMENRRN